MTSQTRVASRWLQAYEQQWAGIDIRSLDQRVTSWWDDLELLFLEYWSFQNINLKRANNKITFTVNFKNRDHAIMVKGVPTRATVYCGAQEKVFTGSATLWEILMWIDGRIRDDLA